MNVNLTDKELLLIREVLSNRMWDFKSKFNVELINQVLRKLNSATPESAVTVLSNPNEWDTPMGLSMARLRELQSRVTDDESYRAWNEALNKYSKAFLEPSKQIDPSPILGPKLSMSNLGDLPTLDGKTNKDHDCDKYLYVNGMCMECECQLNKQHCACHDNEEPCCRYCNEVSTEPVVVALEPDKGAQTYDWRKEPMDLGPHTDTARLNPFLTKTNDQLAFERELDSLEVVDHVQRVEDTRPLTKKDLGDLYSMLARIIDKVEESTQSINRAIRLK